MNVAVEQKVELVFENETGLTGERWSMKKVKGKRMQSGEKSSLSMLENNTQSVLFRSLFDDMVSCSVLRVVTPKLFGICNVHRSIKFLILGHYLDFFCVAVTIRGDERQQNISLGDSGKCFSSREQPALMLDRSKLPD